MQPLARTARVSALALALLLALDGVRPTVENVENGSYPVARANGFAPPR